MCVDNEFGGHKMVAKATDLKQLELCYEQSGNQIFFLYGKADCEKEQLLSSFVDGKKFFYYRAREISNQAQVKMMGEEVASHYDMRISEWTYEEYFKRVRSNDPTKLVLIIDEVNYIMKKDESFWKSLLLLKAHKLYPGPVMIILTTSSIVWAEGTMLAEESLYRKQIDMSLKMGDLNFLEVVRAFPDYSVSESVAVYGVLGGVPGYMSRWNPKRSFKQNVCSLILAKDGYLFGQAERLITTELRELSVYNTILCAIAQGKNKLNDLYLETGFSRAKISVYMKNLSQFDIVAKNKSFETGGWENAKKGVYHITDTYVNFWYRFVYPHLSDLYILTPEVFYDKYIAKNLDLYLNRYFIDVCKEYLSLLNRMNRLPITVRNMGSWIGKNGNIDIIAQSSDRRNVVGMCNWEQNYFTVGMLAELEESMRLARVSSQNIYLFSAKSFSPELIELAKTDKRLELIDMKEL